ncbi:hypothetical protein EON68_01255, partial [archaeon]
MAPSAVQYARRDADAAAERAALACRDAADALATATRLHRAAGAWAEIIENVGIGAAEKGLPDAGSRTPTRAPASAGAMVEDHDSAPSALAAHDGAHAASPRAAQSALPAGDMEVEQCAAQSAECAAQAHAAGAVQQSGVTPAAVLQPDALPGSAPSQSAHSTTPVVSIAKTKATSCSPHTGGLLFAVRVARTQAPTAAAAGSSVKLSALMSIAIQQLDALPHVLLHADTAQAVDVFLSCVRDEPAAPASSVDDAMADKADDTAVRDGGARAASITPLQPHALPVPQIIVSGVVKYKAISVSHVAASLQSVPLHMAAVSSLARPAHASRLLPVVSESLEAGSGDRKRSHMSAVTLEVEETAHRALQLRRIAEYVQHAMQGEADRLSSAQAPGAGVTAQQLADAVGGVCRLQAGDLLLGVDGFVPQSLEHARQLLYARHVRVEGAGEATSAGAAASAPSTRLSHCTLPALLSTASAACPMERRAGGGSSGGLPADGSSEPEFVTLLVYRAPLELGALADAMPCAHVPSDTPTDWRMLSDFARVNPAAALGAVRKSLASVRRLADAMPCAHVPSDTPTDWR